jgi:hypothetical protein
MKKSQRLIERSRECAALSASIRGTLSAAVTLIALLTSLTLTTQATDQSHFLNVSSGLSTGDIRVVDEAQQGGSNQLTLTFTGQGVSPSSATMSAGIIHLFVENQSGQEQLTLRVTKQGGAVVREITVTGKKIGTELPLETGQYVLSETGNAGWSCQLTVQ